MEVIAGFWVVKEMRTWVEEIGVMRGEVRMPEALILFSCEVLTSLIMEGSKVTAEKTTITGIRTAKAERSGIPQSLW